MGEIATEFAHTERMRFHYRRHGAEDGLPMLLIHGSFASSRWWEPFLQILPDAVLAVAPDLRGCGLSDRAATGYGIEEQAVDLQALVTALAWDEFDLVAHSSGGAIAVEFTLNHPGRVRTLSLVDSVPVEGVFTPLDTYVLLEQMRTDRALLRQALAALMPTFPTTDSQEHAQAHRFFERLVDDAQQMAPAAFTAVAEALGRWNRFAEARQLTLPCLIVWGDQDVIVDRDAVTRSLLTIPGASNLEVLRGVGHSPMIEAPVTLAERIIEFLAADYDEYGAIRSSAENDA